MEGYLRDWEPVTTNDGRRYYRNRRSGATSWLPPAENYKRSQEGKAVCSVFDHRRQRARNAAPSATTAPAVTRARRPRAFQALPLHVQHHQRSQLDDHRYQHREVDHHSTWWMDQHAEASLLSPHDPQPHAHTSTAANSTAPAAATTTTITTPNLRPLVKQARECVVNRPARSSRSTQMPAGSSSAKRPVFRGPHCTAPHACTPDSPRGAPLPGFAGRAEHIPNPLPPPGGTDYARHGCGPG